MYKILKYGGCGSTRKLTYIAIIKKRLKPNDLKRLYIFLIFISLQNIFRFQLSDGGLILLHSIILLFSAHH